MIHTQLPYNPVISSMRYHNEVIYIEFKKPKGKNEVRAYVCPQSIAYGLFYTKTGKDTMLYFNNNIKRKLKLIDITLR